MASVASQDSYVNLTTSYWAKNGTTGSAVSTFSTINISTASIENAVIADLNNLFFSTQIMEAEEAFISSISTLGIYLDGNLLTTAGSELLLNGTPIATTSNVSSIADWSYDPAISTLNMNGNSSINGALTSTNILNAGKALITNLVCNDISTITLTVISTIHEISSISSLIIEAQEGIFSTIKSGTGSVSSLNVSTINGAPLSMGNSTFVTASVSSLSASTINGVQFPGSNADATQWAIYPAVSSIYSGAGATADLNLRATRFINEFATGISTVVDRGADVGGNSFYRITAQNGNRGEISLTANPGYGGIYGQIGLTANGGEFAGIGTGGLIELTANTPLTTPCNATSAIKFSAAGINSYAGAVPAIGSLGGYNFIYGTLGVNLCAGLPPIFPNVPGTTYLYGTNGITLGSQTNTAADFVQSGGGVYTTLVTGYWPGGVLAPSNLLIRGRQISLIGNSYVSMCNVDVLSFDAGASGAITGVQTINGAAYPPPAASIPPNLIVSTVVAATSVSTPSLLVSTINGAEYIPGGVSPNLIVSSLVAATSVSTPSLLVSTINGVEYVPGGVSPDLVVSSLVAANSVSTPSLLVSTINGAAYVPGGVSPNLIVSSLVAANSVSTPSLLVSTINGVAYNPGGVSPNLIVSSLVAASSISTTHLNISTINGQGITNLTLSSLNVGRPNPVLGSDFAAGLHLTSQMYFEGNNASNINQGVMTLNRGLGYFFDPNLSTFPALVVDAFSTLSATQPFICSKVYFNGGGNATKITPITADGDANIVIPFSSLIGISTINGVAYNPGGVSPNLIVSSLVAAQSVSTPSLLVSTINGAEYIPGGVSPNLVVSSLVAATSVSTPELFISSVNGSSYPPPSSGGIQSTISNAGSYISINSTGTISISTSLGVPINTRDFNVYVDNNINLAVDNGGLRLDNKSNGAYLDIGTAGVTLQGTGGNSVVLDNDGGVNITASGSYVNITGLSTVNGAPYGPFSSIVGALGAANGSVIVDSAGAISSVTAALKKYAVYSAGGIDLTTNGLGIELRDTDSGGSLTIRGDVTVTGNSMILGSVPLSVSTIRDVDTINGVAYPPPSAPIPANLVVSTLLTAQYVSTPELFISSINGGIYPPATPGGSPNGLFSTVSVSSFVTAPDLIAVSSLSIGNPSLSTCGFIYPRDEATSGDITITPGSYVGASGYVTILDPIVGYGKLQAGEITQLQRIIGLSSFFQDMVASTINVSTINGGIPALLYSEVEFGQVTASTFIADATYTSTLSVSTINSHPFPLPAGIHSTIGTATTQTISIPGIFSTSIVNVTYIHSGGGGGSQYLQNVIPGTDSVSTIWNQNPATGDRIIWSVLKF